MTEHQPGGAPGGASPLARSDLRALRQPWLVLAALAAMLAVALVVVPPSSVQAAPDAPQLIGNEEDHDTDELVAEVAPTAEGSLLFASVLTAQTGALAQEVDGITDDLGGDGGTNWNRLTEGGTEQLGEPNSSYRHEIWYRELGSGGSDGEVTVTFEGDSHRIAVQVIEVTGGFDRDNPIGERASGAVENAEASALTITFDEAPAADSLVLAGAVGRGDDTEPFVVTPSFTPLETTSSSSTIRPSNPQGHLLSQYRMGGGTDITWSITADIANVAASAVEIRAEAVEEPTPPPFVPPAPVEPTGDCVIDEDGGVCESDSGRIVVTVPEEAVDGDTWFTVTDLGTIDELPDEADDVPAGTILFGDYVGQISAMDENGDDVTEFGESLAITLILDEEDLEGLSEDDPFVVTYWNGDEWIALYTEVDLESGEVTAHTDHLTLFALLEGEVEFSPEPESGVTLLSLVTAGAEPEAIEQALEREGCDAMSIWVTEDGEFFGHVFGAPDFVNSDDFPHSLPAGAVFLSACAA